MRNREGESVTVGRTFLSQRAGMLCTCSLLLSSIAKAYPVPGLRVEISKVEVPSQLNELFTFDGIHDILEWKYYQCINMVSPLIFSYVNSATAYNEDTELTKFSTMYSELLLDLYFKCSKRNKDFKA